MSQHSTTPCDSQSKPPNRREFLVRSAAAVTAAAVGSNANAAPPSGRNAERSFSAPRAVASASFATVVMAQDDKIVPSRIVQRSLLRAHLDRVVAAVMKTADSASAWHRLLRPDDRILIKFNQSMATLMGTTDAMAAVLVASLVDAGFAPDRMTLLEVPSAIRSETGTRRPAGRWQGNPVEFGASGADCFSADLDWATAVINVPFLKTHHRALMTGCLKNLSHGLIRHPARFHENGCDPAIGEINASPPLRDRVKLHIVNGLRVAFDRGPDASENELATEGTLIAGTDGVACDVIGFRELNRIRANRRLGPLLPGPALPRQLVTAGRLGVGITDPERIKLERRGADAE